MEQIDQTVHSTFHVQSILERDVRQINLNAAEWSFKIKSYFIAVNLLMFHWNFIPFKNVQLVFSHTVSFGA